jgi:hypothetical protein
VESGRAPALALFDEVAAAACAPVTADDAREFAARFTADYLSWDADFPYTRYRCLQPYFAHDAAAALGWDGRGRQDVNLVIPGAITRLDARHVVVAVTARIVLHVRDGSAPPAGDGHEELPVPPGLDWASATPLGSRAWRPVATAWTALRVPVGRGQDGGLVVQPHAQPAARRGGAG